MTPRLALLLVRLAALLSPASWRARMRREWEAELAAASARGEGARALVRFAAGAFADARALRTIESGRSADAEGSIRAWTSGWTRDLAVAARSLMRAPAYTAVAVVTLALGLGGGAAIFTVLDRVVLDPLPYPDAERLVQLQNLVPQVGPDARWNTSTAQYVYFSDHAETLEAVGIYTMGGSNLQTPAGAERLRAATVTAEVLDLLGARPSIGRLMTTDDNRPGSGVVLLSHGFWTRALGADAGVVGRTVSLNDLPYEVIGVLEPGPELPDAPPGFRTDVWIPFEIDRAGVFYNSHFARMIGRLAPGADTLAAAAELARLTARFPEVFPRAYSIDFLDSGFRTLLTPLKSSVVGEAGRNLWIVFGGVGLVLLIACANVANLFLVRMEGRQRELAVRAALGAARGQVARYLVAEGLVLAGAGGVLALLVSALALGALPSLGAGRLPRIEGVGIGTGTVLFTLGLAGVVGVALALHPLLLHTRRAPAGVLGESGRSGSGGRASGRFRSALVVTQVAMALVLAVSAGLLMDSMRRLLRIEPGVDPEGVLVLDVHLTQARYPDDLVVWPFYREALARVRALPGVVAAGVSQEIPFSGGFGCTVQGFEDPAVVEQLNARDLTTCAGQEPTSPGYFEAMGIPLVAGRTLEDADNDDPSRAAVVVSRSFAERFWPGQDAIGRRVAPNGRDEGFYTVVGVVGDVPAGTLEGARAITVYYPIVQEPTARQFWWPGSMRLVVKSALEDPAALLPGVRQAVADVDPSVPVDNARTLEDVIAASMTRLSFTALLLTVAAGTALLLAAVGLYGVVSYAVTRRTREIGMRIAIGARPGQVERMVVAHSLGLAGAGLAVGVAAAFLGTRVLSGLLYGVAPDDPRAFIAAAALLLFVALLASWIPARRAARVDPSEALREA